MTIIIATDTELTLGPTVAPIAHNQRGDTVYNQPAIILRRATKQEWIEGGGTWPTNDNPEYFYEIQILD